MLKKVSLKKVALVVYAMMIILMIVDVVTVAVLPWLVKLVVYMDIGAGYQSIINYDFMYKFFLAILYIGGLLGLLVLNELRKMFKSCMSDDIFIHKNVKRLFRMSIASFLIALTFLAKVFLVNSFMTMVVVFVFLLASVFCLVLSLVFEEAVRHKEENDLTI